MATPAEIFELLMEVCAIFRIGHGFNGCVRFHSDPRFWRSFSRFPAPARARNGRIPPRCARAWPFDLNRC